MKRLNKNAKPQHMKEKGLSENKIDKNVEKVVNEVTGSVWMRRFFKLIFASIVGVLLGVLSANIAHESSMADNISILIGCGVGLITFFVIWNKK